MSGPRNHVVKALRLAGLMCTGAQVGISFSHALQASGKRRLPVETFLRVQNTLLRNYAAGGGAVETGAMLSTLAAAILGRERREVTRSHLFAFVCTAAMVGVWAQFIEPINEEVRGWTPETVPADWQDRRERWHALHAVRLALAVLGFATLASFAVDGDRARRSPR